MSDRLGKVAVGAKLLAEADEDKGLNEPVKVSSHRVALLGRKNPVRKPPPVSQLSAGRVAPPFWLVQDYVALVIALCKVKRLDKSGV